MTEMSESLYSQVDQEARHMWLDEREDDYMHMSEGEYNAAAHAEAIRNGLPCPFDCAACDVEPDDYEDQIAAQIAAEEERIDSEIVEDGFDVYAGQYEVYYTEDDLPF